jgi:chemotaxis protein methyltransferase CheR
VTIAPEAFSFVRDLVRRESAIVLGPGKEYLVESRLLPLARKAGATDVNAYVSALRSRPDVAASRLVVEALTTNETSWFRDVEPFVTLRTTALKELAQSRPQRRLRIWCGACSTGQEPYSVAMSVLDEPSVAGWSTEIVATDLSAEVLGKAKAGRYTQLEVNRGLPVTQLVKHFVRDGAEWHISKQLAGMVSFREVNLVRPFPPLGGRFDVVFLRNVLIYFDLETKRDILRRIRQVLAPDGFLFLGAAEMTMGVDDAWERLPVGRSSVYQLRKDVRG